MSTYGFRLLALSLLFLSFFLEDAYASTNREFIRIGTGSISGVYYSVGNAVCRFMQRDSSVNEATKRVVCSVQSTPGGMYNLNALRNGDLEIGVAQSDWATHIYNSEGIFNNMPPMKNLRVLFSTHREALVLLTREDSGIKSLEDIKGKIVNIGAPGTSVRGVVGSLLNLKGCSSMDFKMLSQLNTSEQVQALCDGKIDVMTTVIGTPSGTLQEATATCNVKFIPLDKDTVDAFIKEHPYYSPYELQTDIYFNEQGSSISTISVQAGFYVRDDFSDKIVTQIMKAIFSNFSTLRSTHPAFANLTKIDLIPDLENAPVPLHKAAQSFYQKVGILQQDGKLLH